MINSFFPLPKEVTYTITAPALRRDAKTCPVQLSDWMNCNIICQFETSFPVSMNWSTYLLLPQDAIPHVPATGMEQISWIWLHLSWSFCKWALLPVKSELDSAHSNGWNWIRTAEYLFWWQHNRRAASCIRTPSCQVYFSLQLAQCP